MTIQELLEPRFKVISDYPNCPFKVGSIQEVGEQVAAQMGNYPHLFRKLFWYQHRTLADLPNYVRINGFVWKVDRWVNGILDVMPVALSDNERPVAPFYEFLTVKWHFNYMSSMPATEEEYNLFISEQEQRGSVATTAT